jgi:hypothetical protein
MVKTLGCENFENFCVMCVIGLDVLMLLSLSSCYFLLYCCIACVCLFVGISIADLGVSKNFSGGSNS